MIAKRASPAISDRTVRKLISGSAALFRRAAEAAEQRGETFAGWIDGAIRARLGAEGHEVPPPLPPKRNGPRPRSPFTGVAGIGEHTELALERAGCKSLEELLAEPPEELSKRAGISVREARGAIAGARRTQRLRGLAPGRAARR